MNMNKGVSGAKRATYKASSPRELLVRVIEEHNVRASDEVILSAFKRALAEQPDCEEIIIEWWFDNNVKSLRAREMKAMPKRTTGEKVVQLAPSRKSEASQVKEATGRMVEVIKANIAKIALRDMLLPNGKKLKDCTFGELRKLSPVLNDFLARVAAKGKKDEIVGRVLSEVELHELYSA
jgi:hypothetical protein